MLYRHALPDIDIEGSELDAREVQPTRNPEMPEPAGAQNVDGGFGGHRPLRRWTRISKPDGRRAQ